MLLSNKSHDRETSVDWLWLQGRRFMGPNGLHVAATIIQAMFRRYRDRMNYLDYRRKKWAAGVIALSWIMHIKMGQVRTQLKQARTEQLDAFRRRSLVSLLISLLIS